MNKIWRGLKDVPVYLLVIFICGELALRFIYGHTDEDGNFLFGYYWLRPYHLPIKQAEEFGHPPPGEKRYIDYDPLLGWTPVAGASSFDGLYHYNAAGIRVADSQSETSPAPAAGVLRIALFGDSYTHGDEVAFQDTWGQKLEAGLAKRGVKAQVLNFGVAGYGMDQAFLRWQKDGARFSPQIVIFGLQVENVDRNVNLMRYMLNPTTGMLFFKPRFIREGGQLRLVNAPPPRPDEIAGILRHYDDWQMSHYEGWYERAKYQDHFWLKSRFLSLLVFFHDKYRPEEARRRAEREVLSLEIIRRFREDVESKGARFIVVYLPHNIDLGTVLRNGRWPSAELVDAAGKIAPLVHPGQAFVEEARRSSPQALFGKPHYTARANALVAAALAGALAPAGSDGKK